MKKVVLLQPYLLHLVICMSTGIMARGGGLGNCPLNFVLSENLFLVRKFRTEKLPFWEILGKL